MKDKIVFIDDKPYIVCTLKSGYVLKAVPVPRDEDDNTIGDGRDHTFYHLNESTNRKARRCDICDKICTAETIQFHNWLHLCMQCKEKVEAIPDGVLHNLAKFINGEVS